MTRIKLTYSLIFLLLTQLGFGQKPTHLAHLDMLTAPGMYGRGYVNKGDSIAAAYISSFLKEQGMKFFGDSYYQPYTFSVNTFPGKMLLILDEDTLRPGVDYLIDPNSGAGEKEMEVVTVSSADFTSMEKLISKVNEMTNDRKAAYLNTKGIKDKDSLQFIHQVALDLVKNGIPVIKTEAGKLMWGVGKNAVLGPFFLLKEDTAPEEIGKISFAVNQQMEDRYTSQNVIGFIEGSNKDLKKEVVVFSAHYDHLGMMGKQTYFPGANDNASGTTMLLTLAEHYAKNPPERTVVFMFFSGEEAGLLGSKHYVENPLFPLDNIRFLINLDIFGSGDEGITVVNGDAYPAEFEVLQKLNKRQKAVRDIKNRKESYNSDHYPFAQSGVPAWFIYTLGKAKQYHDIFDLPDKLHLKPFLPLKGLLVSFVEQIDQTD